MAALHLAVRGGTLVAVTGAAGSGKSSVLDVIAGRRRPDRGTVRLDGTAVKHPRAASLIAAMSQAHELLPTLTALENVTLAPLTARADADAAWQGAADALDRLGLPRAAQANLAEELSGGQHQRVAPVAGR